MVTNLKFPPVMKVVRCSVHHLSIYIERCIQNHSSFSGNQFPLLLPFTSVSACLAASMPEPNISFKVFSHHCEASKEGGPGTPVGASSFHFNNE